MTIRAQSADGQIHEFPDGTDPAVVDRTMKSYAQSQQQQGPDQGAIEGAGIEIVEGVQ